MLRNPKNWGTAAYPKGQQQGNPPQSGSRGKRAESANRPHSRNEKHAAKHRKSTRPVSSSVGKGGGGRADGASPNRPSSGHAAAEDGSNPLHRQSHSKANGGRHANSTSTTISHKGGAFREFSVASGRFLVQKHLGGGSFGEIYCGLDSWRNCQVALKFEMVKARPPQLAMEYRVYRYIHRQSSGVVGIPEVHWFGTEGDYNIMVMDMCGPSLEDLFMYCERRFSLKTVCMLADQMLHRIQFVHSHHFLHRDIKAENFTMGLVQRAHHVYLLDFGLAKRFWNPKTMQHIPYKEGKALTGTARYCSINVHLGLEQSRRDDMESIGYLLVYFAKGVLPWQGVRAQDAQHKIARIGEKKISTTLEALCRDLPTPFFQFMRYVRMLRFEEAPDYLWCRRIFSALMEKEGLIRDWKFDWVDRRQRELDYTSSNATPNQKNSQGSPLNVDLHGSLRQYQATPSSASTPGAMIPSTAHLSTGFTTRNNIDRDASDLR